MTGEPVGEGRDKNTSQGKEKCGCSFQDDEEKGGWLFLTLGRLALMGSSDAPWGREGRAI
jgi:hypothetical protein